MRNDLPGDLLANLLELLREADEPATLEWDEEHRSAARIFMRREEPARGLWLTCYGNRITVGGMSPKHEKYHFDLRTDQRPLGNITVDMTREAKAAARDIMRRFWPRYAKAWECAAEGFYALVDRERAAELLMEQLVEDSAGRLKKWGRSEHEGDFGSWDNATSRARVRVSVERTRGTWMELSYLSTKQARAVIAALASIPDEFTTNQQTDDEDDDE